MVLSQPVPGINGTTFGLKDFTQKSIFNSTGETGQYICEDCKYYLPLTNSPEQCVDVNGNLVTCVDVTELGSPFAGNIKLNKLVNLIYRFKLWHLTCTKLSSMQ